VTARRGSRTRSIMTFRTAPHSPISRSGPLSNAGFSIKSARACWFVPCPRSQTPAHPIPHADRSCSSSVVFGVAVCFCAGICQPATKSTTAIAMSQITSDLATSTAIARGLLTISFLDFITRNPQYEPKLQHIASVRMARPHRRESFCRSAPPIADRECR
jgi:hypothetical protein